MPAPFVPVGFSADGQVPGAANFTADQVIDDVRNCHARAHLDGRICVPASVAGSCRSRIVAGTGEQAIRNAIFV